MKTIQDIIKENIDKYQVAIMSQRANDMTKACMESWADQEKRALKEKHDAELSMIKGLIENAFVAGRSKEPWADFKQRISDSGKITNW